MYFETAEKPADGKKVLSDIVTLNDGDNTSADGWASKWHHFDSLHVHGIIDTYTRFLHVSDEIIITNRPQDATKNYDINRATKTLPIVIVPQSLGTFYLEPFGNKTNKKHIYTKAHG